MLSPLGVPSFIRSPAWGKLGHLYYFALTRDGVSDFWVPGLWTVSLGKGSPIKLVGEKGVRTLGLGVPITRPSSGETKHPFTLRFRPLIRGVPHVRPAHLSGIPSWGSSDTRGRPEHISRPAV